MEIKMLAKLVLVGLLLGLVQTIQMPPQSIPDLKKRDFSGEFERVQTFAMNFPGWKSIDLSVSGTARKIFNGWTVDQLLAHTATSNMLKTRGNVATKFTEVKPVKVPSNTVQALLQKTHEKLASMKLNTFKLAEEAHAFRQVFQVDPWMTHALPNALPFTLDWWLAKMPRTPTSNNSKPPSSQVVKKPVMGSKHFNFSSLLPILTPFLNQTVSSIFHLDKNSTDDFNLPFLSRVIANLTLSKTTSSEKFLLPFLLGNNNKPTKSEEHHTTTTTTTKSSQPKMLLAKLEVNNRVARQFGGDFGGGGGFGGGGFGGGGFGGHGFGGGGMGGNNFNNNNGGGGFGNNFNNNNGGGGFGNNFNNNNGR